MSFLQLTTGSHFLIVSDMEGILLVNKPKGPTSFQIIKLLRRISGEKKIGHTGTIDPDARGLLLVVFGRATKTVRFLQELRKEYIAKILLGVSTETDDISGRVISKQDISPIPIDTLRITLKTFEGNIRQVPPKFSAVKIKGERAYSLARRGEDFILKEKNVTIHRIEIIYYSHPYLKILVECSKGTYIRAIARDIGKMLGTCATLFSLLRSSIGKWTLRESLNINDIMDRRLIKKQIIPVGEVIMFLPQTVISNLKLKEGFLV